MMTPEQKAALEHVAEIEAEGWEHSITSCPPFTRAMCRYRKELEEIASISNDEPSEVHDPDPDA